MIKIGAAVFALCVAGVWAAQPPTAVAQSAQSASKHYRLTFVLTYPEGTHAPQSLVLDVPVSSERAGMSGMSLATGLTGQVERSVQESLQCTDVKESETGLAAKVTFTMETVTSEPALSATEPIHHQLNFDRSVDLVLGKPTRITEEMQRRVLGKTDPTVANALPAAPQITVTAVEM
jgi:hypothetical protein